MHICSTCCLTPPSNSPICCIKCLASMYRIIICIDINSGQMAPQFYLNLMMAYELMGRSP